MLSKLIKMILISNNTIKDIQLIEDSPLKFENEKVKCPQHSNQQTEQNSSSPQRSYIIHLKISLAPFQISKGLM